MLDLCRINSAIPRRREISDQAAALVAVAIGDRIRAELVDRAPCAEVPEPPWFLPSCLRASRREEARGDRAAGARHRRRGLHAYGPARRRSVPGGGAVGSARGREAPAG